MIANQYEIVFFGGIYPANKEREIFENSKKEMQLAANKMQWLFINGLDINLKKPIRIINLMFIGSYPQKYKKIIIKPFNFSHMENSHDQNLGFINLKYIKEVSRSLSIKRYINKNKKWIRDHNAFYIFYSVQNIWFDAIKAIKKINKNSHVCLIVPDLPKFTNMSYDSSFLHNIYKKHIKIRLDKNINNIDSYVYLTEHMKDYFVSNKPYTVIEGMVDINKNSLKINKKHHKSLKTVVYTGNLSKKYGILNLIKAFMMIDKKNYRLIICGDGDLRESVVQYSSIDSRILYMGVIKNDEIIKIQTNSTVLINPRQNFEEFTKYSFPSKIMEYLSSGTPVIAYKLDGIPSEYDQFIHYIQGNNYESIKDKILEVCEKDETELFLFGKRASDFVSQYKNNVIQSYKIIEMFNNILK